MDPFKPLKGKNLDLTQELYGDVLRSAETTPKDFPQINLEMLPAIEDALTQNGFLRYRSAERNINWIDGFVSLLSPKTKTVMQDIVHLHQDTLNVLFRLAKEQIDGFDPNRMYLPFGTDEDPMQLKSGQRLATELFVPERDRLTEAFIVRVLRPYHQAKIRAYEVLWSRLAFAHLAGQIVVFKRGADGKFGLVLPGNGFDGKGGYQVPRQDYLKATRYADREVPDFDAGVIARTEFRFLTADQLQDYCVYTQSESSKSRMGRPRGTGIDDKPILKNMANLLNADPDLSVRQSAKMVVKKHHAAMRGASIPAKEERLRRKYRKKDWDN